MLCVFAAAGAALAVNRIAAKVSAGTTGFLWRTFKWLVDAGFVVAVLYLSVSGIAGWCLGGMTWWWLMLHMVAGGALAGAVAAMALLRHGERTGSSASAVLWTLWLVLAAATVFTAVMPMMHVFGSDGQEFLLWSHRLAALAFVAVSALVCLTAAMKRK